MHQWKCGCNVRYVYYHYICHYIVDSDCKTDIKKIIDNYEMHLAQA